MNLWKKLFASKPNAAEATSSSASARAEPPRTGGSKPGVVASVKLPQELDGPGDLNVREVIKAHNPARLREILRALPVESITLDQVLAGDTRRHDKLFELCIQFSSVLANYDALRRDHPEFGLPAGFPAQELGDALISRFTKQIQKQNAPDIIVAAGPRLLSFALDMIKAGRNHEALECLGVCKGVLAINRDEVSFWTWACLNNIASKTKKADDLRRALEAAEGVPAHRRPEIAKAIEWTRKQLAG